LPLFHNFGFSFALILIQTGGANIIVPKFDVDLALKHIQKDKATIFGTFPPMLDLLLDKAKKGKHDLSSLRIVLGIDRVETVKKFEAMTGATYWTGYAQTETTGFISSAPYHEKPSSSGIPGFVTEIEIMDEHGKILGINKIGEIVIRGPMVFKGYWNLSRDNEYTFRDGWHHTGDIGRFDEDGYLWYEGPKAEKELIKSGGENVYPAEVEKVVLEHPLIEEASVIGVPDKQWGEAIKAICVLRKGKSLEEAELIEFVGKRIARFKKPKHILFVSKLPKTEDGSIDRQKIKVIHGDA
jgi:long-chain acyl-CoA synthetase